MNKLDLIQEIANKRNQAFYVFDKRGFIDNYKHLESCFKSVYSNYKVSYSFKTNYTPSICELVKSMGGYAEVVSDMEYELAKKLGYKNNEIVYNGPAKEDFLEEHLLNGGITNVDNLEELSRIISLASIYKDKCFDIGLRLNFDINESFISRFGFELDGYEMHQAIEMINRIPNLNLVGFHCHISRSRSLHAWYLRAKLLIESADKYIIGTPKYLSMGGGMFADMDDFLKKQFVNVPKYEDYIEGVFSLFAERYRHVPKDKKPIVFTEPGTTLVARYISFVTKLLNIRTIRGRNLATTNGSYLNLGEICTMKKLPLTLIHNRSSSLRYFNDIDIVGYTCLEQDVMFSGYCGELAIGDIIIFNNAGSYSIVTKPPFIHPNVAMFELEDDMNYKMIMKDEIFDDVFSKFEI